MKLIRSVGVISFVGVGMIVTFIACQQNAIDKPQTANVPSNSIMELVALGEKTNPSSEETDRFNALYQQLSLDELIQYRQGQYVGIRKQFGNTEAVNQALQADLVWWKQINQTSKAKFGKPANQIDAQERDQLFNFVEQESLKTKAGARAAACPVIQFNANFTRGSGGATQLIANRASEVDPGGKNDCDCQLTFATGNTAFRRLVPQNTNAANLLADFGGTLGGRQLTGASAGTYPVWGKTRVTFRYPSQVTQGCVVLQNQYKLSNQ